MNRSKTFPLAVALAAAAAPWARALERVDARADAPAPQPFQMSPGHFHFAHGFDLGPPGTSEGAADPEPMKPKRPRLAQERFEPGLHYSGWRLLPPERVRLVHRAAKPKRLAAPLRRELPIVSVQVVEAPSEGYWDRLRGWIADLARDVGWLPPAPAVPQAVPATRVAAAKQAAP